MPLQLLAVASTFHVFAPLYLVLVWQVMEPFFDVLTTFMYHAGRVNKLLHVPPDEYFIHMYPERAGR